MAEPRVVAVGIVLGDADYRIGETFIAELNRPEKG